MKKTAVSEYGYINAKLRSRISTILTEDFKRSLLETENIEAAVQFLSDNGYPFAAEIWHSTGDIQSLEFELFKNQINNYRLVMNNTDGNLKLFANVAVMKPEIENIKAAVRLWYGSRIRKRPVGYRSAYIYKDRIYENINWEELINAVGYEDITAVFKNTVYNTVFASHSILDTSDRLFELETALDRLYYSHLIENTKKLGQKDGAIVNEILSTEIDLQNISWLIRYRHFYKMDMQALSRLLIPGGHGLELGALKSGDSSEDGFVPIDIMKKSYPELSALSISDKHNFSAQAQLFEQLLDETRKRKFTGIITGYPFSIGIILVYFFMAEREKTYISSVLNGKYYKYNSKDIGEIVR